MMDTDLAGVEGRLRDGLGIDAVLALGAVLAVVCWGATQALADRPGLALELVGTDAARAVVGLWIGATALLVAVVLLAGAPALRYAPLLWLWGLLVGAALVVDVAALTGTFEPRLARTLLWTPWPAVLGVGYLATGLLAMGLTNALLFVGQADATSAVGAIVFGLNPILTPVFAALLLADERLSARGAVGMAQDSTARQVHEIGIAECAVGIRGLARPLPTGKNRHGSVAATDWGLDGAGRSDHRGIRLTELVADPVDVEVVGTRQLPELVKRGVIEAQQWMSAQGAPAVAVGMDGDLGVVAEGE